MEVGKRAGMQFDGVRAKLAGGLNLQSIGFDEHAHPNSCGMNSLDRLFEGLEMPGHIKSPFGRYFLAVFRNQTDFVRKNSERGFDNLRRIAHLEVQLCHDAAPETKDISILDVATVSA